MSSPLEFKQRVRLREPLALPPARRRRARSPLLWGALVWGATAVAAWWWMQPVPTRALEARPPAQSSLAPRTTRRGPEAAPPVPPRAAPAPAPRGAAAPALTEPSLPEAQGSPHAHPSEGSPTLALAAPSAAPALSATPSEEELLVTSSAPEPPPPPAASAAAPASPTLARLRPGASCEDAAAAYIEDLAPGAPRDLSREAYARLLERGTWFGHCGLPASARLDVCIAVQNGRPVGVTVSTQPATPHSTRCITAAAWSLRFPVSPKLDLTRTRFERE